MTNSTLLMFYFMHVCLFLLIEILQLVAISRPNTNIKSDMVCVKNKEITEWMII